MIMKLSALMPTKDYLKVFIFTLSFTVIGLLMTPNKDDMTMFFVIGIFVYLIQSMLMIHRLEKAVEALLSIQVIKSLSRLKKEELNKSE